MSAPITVSPDFITAHAHLAAWILSTCLAALFALGGYFTRKLFTVINTGLEDIKEIKEVQTTQASNHLSHIEANTEQTKDAIKEMAAKFDVLIAFIKKES